MKQLQSTGGNDTMVFFFKIPCTFLRFSLSSTEVSGQTLWCGELYLQTHTHTHSTCPTNLGGLLATLAF